ncbi:spore germination protein [Sporosarcina limicola]|uniref:Spore germination protein KA n=1 Tax=Sporosarcina limicola TaxID=34101 RepID=A0A927MR61_9BACL|nr:spore germination protein [Sporosarcina limicola]MBE1555984.1 spore germination protein KA [Sporosarcina limicola]
MNFFEKWVSKSFKESFERDSEQQQIEPEIPLHTSLQDNIRDIKKTLGNSTDIVIREVRIGKSGDQLIGIVYTDGLADKSAITDFIMETLMLNIKGTRLDKKIQSSTNILQLLKDYALTIGDIKDVSDFKTLYNSVLSGETLILIDGHAEGLLASTRSWQDRGVTEPSAESVVRGPRESFSETMRTNTSLIRRKIKDPNLWLETRQIGRVTQTDVAIMFIKGIASDKIVDEVRARLDRIDIDGILESGYIEELIQDDTFTPFPTVFNTERPDVVAAELLEGKVAILIDGTPFVLVVPALLISFIHSPEDYYQRADISSLVRILRYIGAFISLLGPSLYVALTTFHPQMLPTAMLISIASQREGVPFPAFLEAMLMELAFEILREAGLRMPRTIGTALSVVGTLVIGQAAVEAGLVSAVMVIVVSLTAISGFVFPSYSMSSTIRMLRFPMIGLAATFGLFGIIVGLIALILHLCSLRTFGVPYMSPFAPLILTDQKDTILRFPRWALLSRPRLINEKNMIRVENELTQKLKRGE